LFLQKLSKRKPKELKAVVLDNGSFHKSKKLIIPDNIILIFLPPYSPELNPAEQIWKQIKQEFVCKSFETINELGKYLAKQVRNLINVKTVKSICSYKYLQCTF
jgi:transposase